MPRRSLWPDRLPAAIVQLNALERDLVMRRDLETLLGVSKPRAAELMREFGAERVGSVLAIKRPKLLRRFRALMPSTDTSRGRGGVPPVKVGRGAPRVRTGRAVSQDEVTGLPQEAAPTPGNIDLPRVRLNSTKGPVISVKSATESNPQRNALTESDVPVFARHETFAVRSSWLKKGYDAACESEAIFLDDNASVRLGVGKNMVKAIRYWCHAFKVLEETRLAGQRSRPSHPTELGRSLLGQQGWDEFLEDTGSLWYLHWKLVQRPSIATAWQYAFTVFAEREFSIDQLDAALQIVVDRVYPTANIVPASIHKDVLCVIRMYSDTSGDDAITEDTIASPFTALGLIRSVPETRSYEFSIGEKPDLPDRVAVAAFLEYAAAVAPGARTIGIGKLLYEPGSPGMAFKLTESALVTLIESVASQTRRVSLADTAGLIQMSFVDEPSSLARELLASHYQPRSLGNESETR